MKAFVLAATVAAGLLFTASSADAQYRRGGRVYVAPAYNGVYSYNSGVYAPPGYNGVVSVGSYTPLGGTTVVVPSGGLPAYGSSYYAPPVYNSNNFYTPNYNFSGSGVYYGTTRYGRRW